MQLSGNKPTSWISSGENYGETTILFIGKDAETIAPLSSILRSTLIHRDSTYTAVNYLLSGGRPDVILFATGPSGEEGLEFYRFIRKDPEFAQAVFILVSEQFEEEVYKAAFIQGIDDYYTLPLPGSTGLAARIRFLLDHRTKAARQEKFIDGIRIPVSKRIFDIVFATSALVVLSPFLILIMIAIRAESKGKIYYTSKRVGQKPFNFYKFRSMRTGADAELGKLAKEKNKYGSASVREIDFSSACPRCLAKGDGTSCSPVLHIGPHDICEYWYQLQKEEIARSRASFIKIQDDPRITRVGKIIRDLSIDELPQLINVIKGDMSLVGNRPLPVYEAEKLTDDQMASRFLSPAGLTGLWQVELRGRAGGMSERERKRLDKKYAAMFIRKKYSFWYDLKLIFRTIPAIFQKETV
jgi:lipopolysaccharide/colanic/teichoic acid biosynthesis glycosyltransferase/CheY-like chemotaxis protein